MVADRDANPDQRARFRRKARVAYVAGTALRSNPRHIDFFSAMATGLAAHDRLFFVEVRVDDKPLSITANLVDGATVFGFKVAHTPAFAAASPGIFNTLEVARLAHEDPLLTAVNSGSAANSYLLRYWPDSRPVGTVLAATRGFAGSAALSMLTASRWSRRQAGRFALAALPSSRAV
jgi:CelD/BcsL family acetyltransferase involved in cellulose biosynthesis